MKRLITIISIIFSLSFASAQTLMIMGGKDHDVFLGYIDARPSDSKSIWNEYCDYGRKYDEKCIWNRYGTYGSKYNSLSPWNKYSSDVPIIVDRYGRNYGKMNSRNNNKLVRKICLLADAILEGNLELKDAYEILFE